MAEAARDPDAISRFVADLAVARIGATTNQYAIDDPALDRDGGSAVRRATLEKHLLGRYRSRLMLVGEAPSYRGCRFSGLAFTSERSLDPSRWTSLKVDGWQEPSATIVHRTLRDLGIEDDTLLWNACPTHPAAASPLTNRLPTAQELNMGLGWLSRLTVLLEPRRIIAVGRSAAKSLPEATVVRHPAHGGAAEFRRGLFEAMAE